MTTLDKPSGHHLFTEFRCRDCGNEQAYRSRPRNPFERYILPLLWLQAIRCEHCLRRTYAPRSVPVLNRQQFAGKPQAQANESKSDTHVA